jgi:hypothetical protein
VQDELTIVVSHDEGDDSLAEEQGAEIVTNTDSIDTIITHDVEDDSNS